MERHAVVAPDRRAAGLRRLRPGRPADRGDHQEAARGAAARRDREGASGHLQHPAAGDGPRHADRQQRPQGRLPQRHHHHDDQRGRRDAERRRRSASRNAQAGRRRDGRHQAHVHAGVPQPPRRDDLASASLDEEVILRVVDKFLLRARERSCTRRRSRSRSPTRCASTSRKKGFDPLMGARPMARLIQDTIRTRARRRAAVRPARQRRQVTIDIDDDGKVDPRHRPVGRPARRAGRVDLSSARGQAARKRPPRAGVSGL